MEWLLIAVLGVWCAQLTLVVAVVPYHRWDEMAYGEWSRLIAASGELRFPSITADFIEQLGVSPDAEFWAACRSPRLDRIASEGTNAVFEITEPRVPAR